VEVAVVLAFYLAYASTRALAPGAKRDAVANAGRVVSFERDIHLDPEIWLNHLLAPINWLGAFAGYYYLTLHFAVTVAALGWVYLRRPHLYSHARTSLVLASFGALFSFWFVPVAPPRLAEHGIVDVVVQHNTFGAAAAQQGKSSLENVYAAMPSLHVGWALWVALVIHRSFGSRWRELAWLYPLATALVVLSTGNHYLVDAVGGVTIVLAADALTRRLRPARHGSTAERLLKGLRQVCRPLGGVPAVVHRSVRSRDEVSPADREVDRPLERDSQALRRRKSDFVSAATLVPVIDGQ
jgi:hypothetical protein